VSELGDGSELDRVPVKIEEEEDVDMVDVTAVSKPQKKRKAKAMIPVGQNGLKKRKVTKTKFSTDAKGYSRMSFFFFCKIIES
jgi:DNA polymerase delta subunit 3